jgi:hypothetical protein
MPERADAATVARRAALAQAVKDDLCAAGLPVVPDGVDPLPSGARVFVDELDDESGGGVYVNWEAHFALRSAALDAFCAGPSASDPSIRLSSTAAMAMQDAMADILSVAGYQVLKDANDITPYLLKVLRREPGPSWRDWLHAQTTRRAETLRATAGDRPAPGEPDPPSGQP